MSFPALRDAGHDPLFFRRGSVASLYMYLSSHLDFVEFRRVKATKIARELRLKRQTVGSALSDLCRSGYLQRGPHRLLDAYTYRLVYSRGNGLTPKTDTGDPSHSGL